MKIRTIFRYLLLTFAAIIAGVNFQAIIASKLAGNPVPMPFGTGTCVVMSGSMKPELNVGDIVFIKEYKTEQEIKPGDVIVYQSKDLAIVHRVVNKSGDTITTQGDANDVADEPFDVSAVKGTVVFHIDKIGYLVLFLKTPFGIVLTLGLAIFLLEHSFRKEKEQREENVEVMKEEIRSLLREEKRDWKP